ncbi:MAG TPA: tetratricopeptide repeat protein [Gemmataceae bacterium]|nr:tetratricopeptide repeat protein [Gemmataceae bacterium]
MADMEFLKDKQVAVTGRLASLTRTEAAELIQAHGGRCVPTVNRQTAYLIVGQDGWPLQKDGRLTSHLRKAQLLKRSGSPIEVLSEEDLLARIGSGLHHEEVQRLYSTAQLSRILKISGSSLRRWVKTGLLHPAKDLNGISHFDYDQVVSAKSLCKLIQAGVKPYTLRQSMRQLQTWLPGVEQPLLQLAVLEGNGELLVRLEDGLAEPTGQRHFDFDESVAEPTLSLPQPEATPDEWFGLGCDHEEGGDLDKASEAFRQALLRGGPNSVICFNLANVLYRLGNKEQAVERYYQAVELDRSFAEAWNNLGIVLGEVGKHSDAIFAFERAISLSPGYADARYNLADLLDSIGDLAGAASQWQSYLAQDCQSKWAKYARERLTAMGT